MQNNNKSNALILTFVFPFAGLIYSLANWRQPWAKNSFWLACVYMGAVLIFCPEGTVLGIGADGGRYVLRLMAMYNNRSLTIGGILSSLGHDPEIMDLYQPILTYIISRFTDNGHVLFAAFAFVFGFFYSRNIWYVLEKLPNKKLGNLFILVTLYFLICPITQINGVRMWTATHIYVYAMMPYVFERDKSKLWWVLLTPLVHFSFLYVAVFAVAWSILPYRLKAQSSLFVIIALVFFAVTLFINTLNFDAVSGMLEEYSPETYEGHISGYVSQDYADARAEASSRNNWYVAASGNISHWCYNILLLALLPCLKRNFKKDDGLMHLYTFTLFLGGFANIMALIPSGGRFQVLSLMFKVPLILLVVMSIPTSDSFKKLVTISLFFLLLPFVFEIRKLLDFFSITVIIGNFLTLFFWENNVPLIDFIKQLL